MKIQSQQLSPSQSVQTTRVSGFSSRDLQAATWRGEDLLLQTKKGEVLVLKAANAKRLSTPDFFLVFDDASLPLAAFAPGAPQPKTTKPPHVPPFEIAAPVKVGRLSSGKVGKALTRKGGDEPDEAWAEQARAVPMSSGTTFKTEWTAPTEAMNQPASTQADVASPNPLTISSSQWAESAAALTFGVSAAALSNAAGAMDALTSISTVSGVITLGPVIAGNDLLIKVYDAQGNLLGADKARADGSYTVSLFKKPLNGVIRVDVTAASDAGSDYMGENGQPVVFLGTIRAVSTLAENVTAKVNVTHATDLLARKLMSAADLNAVSEPITIRVTKDQVKALSVATANAFFGVSAPLETLDPTPTVDRSGQAVAEADLYGQLLKVLFQQVYAAKTSTTETSLESKAVATNAALNQLADSMDVTLPVSDSSLSPVVTIKAVLGAEFSMGETMLAAKLANYAQDTNKAENAPAAADYQAAGVKVSPDQVAAINAAAVDAVKQSSATPGNSSILLIGAAVEAATHQNKAPTAVILTTALTGNTIAENTATTVRLKVADIAATDDGLGTNTYTLGGADAASFEVDGNVLYLKANTVLDYETQTSYAVIVTAKDSNLANSTPVTASYTFNISNVNEAPTTNGLAAAVTATMGTVIADIDLSSKFADVDASDTLTYTLKSGSSLPAGLSLNTSTGKITGTPTAVTSGAQSITVVASDAAGLKAEQTFNLSVSDGTAPVFTDGTTQTVSVAENTAATVYTAAATDNVAVTSYAFAGGADDGKFNLDAATGALTFKASPNYEVPGSAASSNAYTVKVKASDAAGNNSTQTIIVNVTNVNEAPTGSVTISGTPTQGQVLTVSDTIADADGIPASGSAGAIAYQWLADGEAISDATGASFTLTQAQVDKTITVKATYTDAAGKVESVTSTATSAVANVNDAPTANGTVAAVTATIGTVIADIDLSNKFADVDASDTLTYSLKSGSSLPAGLSLNASTGKITGTPTALTSGATHITVVATDKLGLTAQQMFDLTVNPPPVPVLLAANDNAGAVTGDVSVTVTRIASASDSTNLNNRITLSPTVAGDMTVEGWFKTDVTSSSTGQQLFWLGGMELFIRDGALKTWAPGGAGDQTVNGVTIDTNWHHYAITTNGAGNWKVLVDGVERFSRTGGSIGSTAAAQTIYVGGHNSAWNSAFKGQLSNLQVWDSQRTADQVMQDMHSLYLGGKDSTGAAPTGLVGAWVLGADTSNQVSGGMAATVGSATSSEARSSYTTDDATPTLSGTLNVALSSDQSLVLMEGSAEVPATVTMGTTGLTWSLTPTTALSVGAHDLVVKVKGAGGTYVAAARDVLHLTVFDGFAPTFGNATQTVSVAENTDAATAVYTVVASDNVAVTSYAFAGGADDAKFNLDTATGTLTFKTSPNYEVPSSAASTNAYTVKVKASDAAGNSSTQTITVNVTDVNEAPTPSGSIAAVSAILGIPIAEINLADKFTDVDAGDTLHYSLKEGSVLPAGLTLDATSGKITGTPTGDPSSATSSTTSITVVATDKGTLTAEQTFDVTINPSDAIAPSFTDGATKVVSVAENTATATTVHTASATDNVAVTSYAFAGGADDGLFNLDTATGALTFKASPNYEAPGSAASTNAYTVKVKASDAAGNEAIQTVTVNVTNVNEAPTGNVTISGTAAQGQVLTVSHNIKDADGIPANGAGAISYQWLANGAPISGAKGSTLVLAQGQVGKTISVKASYTDNGGTAESVTSSATPAVVNVNSPPVGSVTIAGVPTQGQTLTAAYSLSDEDGMGTVGFQWLADGEPISDATGNTLALTLALVGRAISVRAAYIDGQGTAEAVTSTATVPIAHLSASMPVLDLAAGLADGASRSEVTQLGFIAVRAEKDARIDVTFSSDAPGSSSVSRVLFGLGSDQAQKLAALSDAELAKLHQGRISVSAVATNAAGDISPVSTAYFNLDTTAPTVTITSSQSTVTSGGHITYTLAFSEAPVGLTLSDIVAQSGSVSDLQVSAEDAHIYTVQFTARTSSIKNLEGKISLAAGSYTDAAGNGGVGSLAPVVLINPDGVRLTLKQDTGWDTGDLVTSDGTMLVSNLTTGTTRWQYSTNGGAHWTDGADGAFVVPQGVYDSGTIQVRCLNSSSAVLLVRLYAQTFKVDATVPPAPEFQLLADTAQPNDGITSNGYVLVTGLAEGCRWEINWSGDADGGQWQQYTTDRALLPEGFYAAGQVQVRAVSQSGVISAIHRSVQDITVDVTPPDALHLALSQSPVQIQGADGTVSQLCTDGLVQIDGLETSATWAYSTDGGAHWVTGRASNTGTAQLTLPANHYAVGSILVRQTDMAGNTSAVQNLLWTDSEIGTPLVIDNDLPFLRIVQETDDGATPAVLMAGQSVALSFEFSAEVSDFTIDDVRVEGGHLQDLQQDASRPTHWTARFVPDALAQGVAQITVDEGVYKDADGKPGLAATGPAIVYDTSPPSPVQLALRTDTGNKDNDGLTIDPVIHVLGLESGATWQYSVDRGRSWMAGSGTELTLDEGGYFSGQIQVRTSDAAGNYSTTTQYIYNLTVESSVRSSTSDALILEPRIWGNTYYRNDNTVSMKVKTSGWHVGDHLQLRVDGRAVGDPVEVTQSMVDQGYTMMNCDRTTVEAGSSAQQMVLRVDLLDVAGSALRSNEQTISLLTDPQPNSLQASTAFTGSTIASGQRIDVYLRYSGMAQGDIIYIYKNYYSVVANNWWISASDVARGYSVQSISYRDAEWTGNFSLALFGPWYSYRRDSAVFASISQVQTNGPMFGLEVHAGNGDALIGAAELGGVGLQVRAKDFSLSNGLVANGVYAVKVNGVTSTTITITSDDIAAGFKDFMIPNNALTTQGNTAIRLEGSSAQGVVKGADLSVQMVSKPEPVFVMPVSGQQAALLDEHDTLTMLVVQAGMRAGSQVMLLVDGVAPSGLVGRTVTATEAAAGTLRWTLSRQQLGNDGMHTVSATVVDDAGNQLSSSGISVQVQLHTAAIQLQGVDDLGVPTDASEISTTGLDHVSVCVVNTHDSTSATGLQAGDSLVLRSEGQQVLAHTVSADEATAGKVALTVSVDKLPVGHRTLTATVENALGQMAVSNGLLVDKEGTVSVTTTPVADKVIAGLGAQALALRTNSTGWATVDKIKVPFSGAVPPGILLEAEVYIDLSLTRTSPQTLLSLRHSSGQTVSLTISSDGQLTFSTPTQSNSVYSRLGTGWHRLSIGMQGSIKLIAIDGTLTSYTDQTLLGGEWTAGLGWNAGNSSAAKFDGWIRNVRVLNEPPSRFGSYYTDAKGFLPADDSATLSGFYPLDGQFDAAAGNGPRVNWLGTYSTRSAFSLAPFALVNEPVLLPSQPTLSGVVEPGATVELRQGATGNGASLGHVVADAKGHWKLDTSLAVGTYDLTMQITPATGASRSTGIKLDLRNSDVLGQAIGNTQLRKLTLLNGTANVDAWVFSAGTQGSYTIYGASVWDPLQPLVQGDKLDLRGLLGQRYRAGVSVLSDFVQVIADDQGQALVRIDPTGSISGSFVPTVSVLLDGYSRETVANLLADPQGQDQLLWLNYSGLERIQAWMTAVHQDPSVMTHAQIDTPVDADFAQAGLLFFTPSQSAQVLSALGYWAAQKQTPDLSGATILAFVGNTVQALQAAQAWHDGIGAALSQSQWQAFGLPVATWEMPWLDKMARQHEGSDWVNAAGVVHTTLLRLVGMAQSSDTTLALTSQDLNNLGLPTWAHIEDALPLLADVLHHEWAENLQNIDHVTALLDSLQALNNALTGVSTTSLSYEDLTRLMVNAANGDVLSLDAAQFAPVPQLLTGHPWSELQSVKTLQQLLSDINVAGDVLTLHGSDVYFKQSTETQNGVKMAWWVTGRTDTALALSSNTAYMTITGLPSDVALSKGLRDADGYWYVSATELANLQIVWQGTTQGAGENFDVHATLVYQDSRNATRSTSDVFHVTLTPAYLPQGVQPGTSFSNMQAGLRVLWNEGFLGQGEMIGLSDSALLAPDKQFNWDHVIATTSTMSSSTYRSHGVEMSSIMVGQHDGIGSIGVTPEAWLNSSPASYATDPRQRVINSSRGNIDSGTLTLSSDSSVGIAARREGYLAGLGQLFVSSAANQGAIDNTASDDLTLHRAVVTVGAIDAGGWIASFSSRGDALFISSLGVSVPVDSPDMSGNSMLERVSGTSPAAPYVSSVVALMAQANAQLSIRDFKDILAYSARLPGPGLSAMSVNHADRANGGGLEYSNAYGFGVVNPLGAVRLAQSWFLPDAANTTKLANAWSTSTVSGTEDADGVAGWNLNADKGNTQTIEFAVNQSFDVEHVDLLLGLKVNDYDNLKIQLTSPQGTVSDVTFTSGVNASTFSGTKTGAEFKYGLSRFWGEHAEEGVWKLTFDYFSANNGSNTGGQITSAKLVFSTETDQQALNDRFVYTDDFPTLANADAARLVLTDKDGHGVNTLNLAAVSQSAVNVDLASHTFSFSNWNKTVSIADGTTITNVVGTELNDKLLGNELANVLWGGPGNDWLDGKGGNNIQNGGAGDDVLVLHQTNERVTGGDGRDTFVFEGSQADAAAIARAAITDFDTQQDVLMQKDATTGQWSLAIWQKSELTGWQFVIPWTSVPMG